MHIENRLNSIINELLIRYFHNTVPMYTPIYQYTSYSLECLDKCVTYYLINNMEYRLTIV